MIQETALAILLVHISIISILLIIYMIIVELVIYITEMFTKHQVKVRRTNNIIIMLVLSYFIYLTINII
jgi:hypothetical protein